MVPVPCGPNFFKFSISLPSPSCDSLQQESSHVQVDVGNFCLANDLLDDENNINSNITKTESCIDIEAMRVMMIKAI